MTQRLRILFSLVFALSWLGGCATESSATRDRDSLSSNGSRDDDDEKYERRGRRRARKEEKEEPPTRADVPGLELGEYELPSLDRAVLDGDTIRVEGIKSTLRLLGIDCEETFKRDSERAAYRAGWEQYKKAARGGDNSRPVKLATPVGEDAKTFAKNFFKGVDKVRLERDQANDIKDAYGRYLTYVFAQKNGVWKNYNVEVVRAGMSPYFTKYGRSRRFDKDFIAAQDEAQKKKLGVWDPKLEHYDDYPERLAWWNERAAIVTRFEREMEQDPSYIALTRNDALEQIGSRMGQTVTVLGVVSNVRMYRNGPMIARLSRTRGKDLDIVFFDRNIFLESGLVGAKGEYVQVRGMVSEYRRNESATPRLQIVVSLPGQVLAPTIDPNRLTVEERSGDTAAPADDEE